MYLTVEIEKSKYFETFVDLTEKLLDNQLDVAAFEDTMREMFTSKSYKLYTIDKLIVNTAKQVCIL